MESYEFAALVELMKRWSALAAETRREAARLEQDGLVLISTAAGIELCLAQLDGTLTALAGLTGPSKR